MPYRDNGYYEKKHQSLIGQKFNRLTILSIWKNKESGYYMCRCRCDCGNTRDNRLTYVKNGGIKSCGCSKYKHRPLPNNSSSVFDGRSSHPLHKVWNAMFDRCENPNNQMFSVYGGRGISVCQEWRDFQKFVEWSDSVGGRPKGYSLDRIDPNGNYCPENCRWADDETQQNNKRTNQYLTYKGETLSLSQWARKLGISRYAIQYRFMQGWSAEDILEVPLKHRKDEYRRKILQKTKSGDIVAVYNSLSELPEEYKITSVSSACNGHYQRDTYKGYIWEYAEG